jgi:hypothetical protein
MAEGHFFLFDTSHTEHVIIKSNKTTAQGTVHLSRFSWHTIQKLFFFTFQTFFLYDYNTILGAAGYQ